MISPAFPVEVVSVSGIRQVRQHCLDFCLVASLHRYCPSQLALHVDTLVRSDKRGRGGAVIMSVYHEQNHSGVQPRFVADVEIQGGF
jgi:hypothetical protein